MTSACTLRRFEASDEREVLALVDADRLPGQPVATPAMLAEALAGRSSVDSAWWAELVGVATEIATDHTGEVVGVLSYATRLRDGTGIVAWLHGREDRRVVDTLLDHALSRLAGRPVEAFAFATALGLEALPVRHRPVTATALTDRGFTGRDLWRYLRADRPVIGLPRVPYTVDAEDDRRTLTVREATTVLGEATVGVPMQGTGDLWRLGVDPAARGRGLKALPGSALSHLAELGAREVILYVDDDGPGGDRDRGRREPPVRPGRFAEVDRLFSYRRPRH